MNISIVKLFHLETEGVALSLQSSLIWDALQDLQEYKVLTNYKCSTGKICNWAENKAIYYISISAGKRNWPD